MRVARAEQLRLALEHGVRVVSGTDAGIGGAKLARRRRVACGRRAGGRRAPVERRARDGDVVRRRACWASPPSPVVSRPGLAADLLVVDGDVRADPDALGRPVAVLRRGEWRCRPLRSRNRSPPRVAAWREATDTRTSWTSWTTLTPVLAMVVLAVSWGRYPGTVVALLIGVFLVGAVLAAVHHAEVVAHRVGEPFGSLILAVAVTVIEVALIVTLMVSGEQGHLGAGPRHRVRRGDDQRQRHRRALAGGRRAATATERWPSSTPRAPARRWPPWSPWPP